MALQLRTLWKLHLIDAAIVDIRHKAASMDPGRKIQAEIDKLTAVYEELLAKSKALSSELTDLELQQKGIEAKLKKIDTDLYGGKVVNPREVEDLQHQIDVLKKQRTKNDERILELWELVPPAAKAAEDAHAPIDVKKKELAEHQKKVLEMKKALETEFKELNAKRPTAAQAVSPGLLARYDAIRQKHGGIGMTTVDRRGNCTMCGTLLPKKTVESALEDKVVTCEECHRIVYATEGVI